MSRYETTPMQESAQVTYKALNGGSNESFVWVKGENHTQEEKEEIRRKAHEAFSCHAR